MSSEYEISANKNKILSVIIIFLLIISAMTGIYYYNKIFPKQLMNSGKKYLEIKQYDKALRIFRYLENKTPQKIEPVYFEVLTLAKMVPTYENQKRLYEIFLYDNADEASRLAGRILNNFRKQIYLQAGANYADNLPFENTIARWNNSHPITYSFVSNSNIPEKISLITDSAFRKWQNATGGEFKFKKTSDNANIVIHFVKNFPEHKTYTLKEKSAVTIPNISGNKLNRMDIYIKINSDNENMENIEIFSEDKLHSLLLHQIGHALGIGAHSSHIEDIMYYDGDFIDNEIIPKEITKRDLNTLNILYKIVPAAIDTDIDSEFKNNLLYSPIITTYPGENFKIENQMLIKELDIDKKNLGKWVELALQYALNQEYQRANYILESIIPLFEAKKEIKFALCYNIALNYYKIRNYALASKYLNKAEKIMEDKETRTLNAFIDMKIGMTDLAREKLEILFVKHQNDKEIAIKLAEIYYKERNEKLARRVIAKLIKSNPSALQDERVQRYK